MYIVGFGIIDYLILYIYVVNFCPKKYGFYRSYDDLFAKSKAIRRGRRQWDLLTLEQNSRTR